MYLYRGYSATTLLGKGEEVEKESSKNDIKRRAYSQKSDVSHTNSTMYFLL